MFYVCHISNIKLLHVFRKCWLHIFLTKNTNQTACLYYNIYIRNVLYVTHVQRKLPREWTHELENAWENNRPQVRQATVIEYRFDRLEIQLTGGLDIRDKKFSLSLSPSFPPFFFFLVNARCNLQRNRCSIFLEERSQLWFAPRASSKSQQTCASVLDPGKIRALAKRTTSRFFSAFVELSLGIRNSSPRDRSMVNRKYRDDLIAKFLWRKVLMCPSKSSFHQKVSMLQFHVIETAIG